MARWERRGADGPDGGAGLQGPTGVPASICHGPSIVAIQQAGNRLRHAGRSLPALDSSQFGDGPRYDAYPAALRAVLADLASDSPAGWPR